MSVAFFPMPPDDEPRARFTISISGHQYRCSLGDVSETPAFASYSVDCTLRVLSEGRFEIEGHPVTSQFLMTLTPAGINKLGTLVVEALAARRRATFPKREPH